MRAVAAVIALLTVSWAVFGAESGFIPWEEFKSLYRDSIEREIRERTEQLEAAAKVYSIDEAQYRLTAGSEKMRGEVTLAGKVVSGKPEPIPLLGPDAIITELTNATGGSVLCGKNDRRTAFLPEEGARDFQVTASFLVPSREDGGTQVISFEIPRALRNSLALTLPPGARLVEQPGILDADGTYRFATSSCLTVKFIDKQTLEAAAMIEIDAVSRVSVQKQRILINTCFLPVRPGPEAVVLQAPRGAKYLSASLKVDSITPREGDRYELRIPPGELSPLTVEFALEPVVDDGAISFLLPAIESNTGKQGRLVVEEPDEGQATITSAGLVSRIPVAKLGEVLSKHVGAESAYMSVPANEPVTLAMRWFRPVSTPSTVLDCQYLFSSFEENGNILSVLVLDIPPEFGARMELKAVPDSEVWSLKVNGARKQTYASTQGVWIVPLESGQTSRVELAFLRTGPKLGLQGKLEVIVPETGLPSQDLRVGVALPARVDLLFAEGPLSAAKADDWKLPVEFVGRPFFFARSFYKGEGMKLAISYREPMKQSNEPKGGAQ